MSAEKSFFKLLEEKKAQKKILWAPCIYDALSAACAEACGFEAVTIKRRNDQLHGGRTLQSPVL